VEAIVKGLNMKLVWIALWWLSGIIYADTPQRVCWSYDPASFVAWDRWVPPGAHHDPNHELKPIQELYFWQKKGHKNLALMLKVHNHIYRHEYLYEYEQTPHMRKYGGECDSAQLQVDGHMNLHLEFVSFEIDDESAGGVTTELELFPRDPKAWLKPHEIPCPSYVVQGRYVCYNKRVELKGKRHYQGCVRSISPCKQMMLKHFGHYESDASAEEAYWRCKRH